MGANMERRASMVREDSTALPSDVFEVPDLAESDALVSTAEARFFQHSGFLVKRGLLDRAQIDDAMHRVWKHFAQSVPMAEGAPPVDRNDPNSWKSPQWAEMPAADASGAFQGRQRAVHSGSTVKLHELGAADFLVRLVPNHPSVRGVAQALLDQDLRPSTRTRGVYAIFPSREPTLGRLGPHTDQVCQQLNACVYLDDVPPRNGGFTLYPGSHRIMHGAHETEANWSPRPNYRDAIRKVAPTNPPGGTRRGSRHRNLLARPNGAFLRPSTPAITSDGLTFADFSQNRETLSADEHRTCGQFEWFKDTELFRHDTPASARTCGKTGTWRGSQADCPPRRGDPCGRPCWPNQRRTSHQDGRPQGSPLRANGSLQATSKPCCFTWYGPSIRCVVLYSS